MCAVSSSFQGVCWQRPGRQGRIAKDNLIPRRPFAEYAAAELTGGADAVNQKAVCALAPVAQRLVCVWVREPGRQSFGERAGLYPCGQHGSPGVKDGMAGRDGIHEVSQVFAGNAGNISEAYQRADRRAEEAHGIVARVLCLSKKTHKRGIAGGTGQRSGFE